MKFTLPILAAAATLVTAQGTPDQPVTFWADLYNDVADCSGTPTTRYFASQGGCVNKPIDGTGSAFMRIGESAVNFLTAWSGPDCTGEIIFVLGNDVDCEALRGTDALSWSNDDRIFG